jgi:serine-type D-Ala-D-Ala carboxypeptidase (penicillin-binding protein 5/6)
MARRLPPTVALVTALTLLPAYAQPPVEQPLPPRAPADRLDGPPFVTAKAWVVADGATGKVLWGDHEADQRPCASTTKVMTAWVVLQLAAADPKVLDEPVTFSDRAAGTTGSSSKLRAGDRLPARDLLHGMLLPSGNDAAVALAEHFGPRAGPADAPGGDPVGRFVAAMNRHAADLGLQATTYADPNGLSRLNQSSARDLAALACRVMKDDRFRSYVGTRRHRCEVTDKDGEKRAVTWDNINRLLAIDGYDGVKTGTTTPAGACLMASGRRGADHLIVVVLGSTSTDARYTDTRNLFRWAWPRREPAKAGG